VLRGVPVRACHDDDGHLASCVMCDFGNHKRDKYVPVGLIAEKALPTSYEKVLLHYLRDDIIRSANSLRCDVKVVGHHRDETNS
jgi:hypothetical protein